MGASGHERDTPARATGSPRDTPQGLALARTKLSAPDWRFEMKTARDVMNAEVVTVRADMAVREAARILAEKEITGAPAVDDEGRLVGVVSVTDIAESEIDGEALLVRDVMTPTVYTVPEDTPVPQIARTMIAGRIHRLFVTSRGRVVGIVTSLDLMKLLCPEE